MRLFFRSSDRGICALSGPAKHSRHWLDLTLRRSRYFLLFLSFSFIALNRILNLFRCFLRSSLLIVTHLLFCFIVYVTINFDRTSCDFCYPMFYKALLLVKESEKVSLRRGLSFCW